jgi:hypothetical protein
MTSSDTLPFPIPPTRDALGALVELLEVQVERALMLAEDIDDVRAEDDHEAADLAERLRRRARDTSRDLAADVCEVPEALALLRQLEPAIRHGHVLVLGEDMRCALDEPVFQLVGSSTTTLGELAVAAFERFALEVDLARLVPVEQAVDVPLIHGLYRALAAGYVAARDEALPSWFEPALRSLLVEELVRLDQHLASTLVVGSPFGAVSYATLERMSRRWIHESRRVDRRAHADRREQATAPIAELLERQRRELGTLPPLAELYNLGHCCALVERVLDERAREQGCEQLRTTNAVQWLGLVDPSVIISFERAPHA